MHVLWELAAFVPDYLFMDICKAAALENGDSISLWDKKQVGLQLWKIKIVSPSEA